MRLTTSRETDALRTAGAAIGLRYAVPGGDGGIRRCNHRVVRPAIAAMVTHERPGGKRLIIGAR